jgi:hypothetical protein
MTDRDIKAGKDTTSGMAGTERHVYGPRHLAALMPIVTRPAFRRRSPATAQVMADWPVIVGPALAAVTTPRGLSAGTLTIACAGPIAMELTHLADELRARINTHLGSATVTRLRFVQTVQPLTAAPPAVAAPPPATARAARAVSALPDGPVKDALAGLGALVLAGTEAEIPPAPAPRHERCKGGRTTTY